MNQIQSTLKTSFTPILVLCCVMLIVASCSRKKNTFINRNFHALGTKYNILYNGNLALENGRAAVDDAFTDNYWDLLSVERMETIDEVSLEGESGNPNFERAEGKAIKAVQKHGMNIKGKEYNPQIDEAYLLLGKARYFDQRFIPALEAFNYILYKYPASDKINTAKIWREKTNIRLENNELAIKNLKRLLEQEELEDQDLADATAMLAQAYINIKAKDSALPQLLIAAKHTKKKQEEARYNYIIGQLYNEFGKKDSANIAFDKVIEMHRKIPRPYYINAHLEKIKNFDPETGDRLEFETYLSKLESNRENRPFLDKIYYRIAEYYQAKNADSIAENYYQKSLRTNTQDQYLKSLDYSILGDMYFDRASYRIAGAYYDSTLTNLKPNSKSYRIFKKKRDNLDDVIKYEDIAQRNDSILNLVALSDENRLALFTEYIIKLKAEAETQKEKEDIAKRKQAALSSNANNNVKSSIGNKSAGNTSKSTFYFYNPTTVAYGKNEFLKIWGERQLQDNWRWSSDNMNANAPSKIEQLVETASDEERFDPEFYISKIPSDQKEIDSIIKQRNFAYYQLGVIYKEKFQEYELAKNKLQKLLNNNPEERLVLPSKYNLYKIYTELGMESEAEITKKDIIANYPNSRYAEILLNPEAALANDEGSPENIYEKLYQKFSNQEYAVVVQETEKYIKQFEGDPLVPKFEILKASARGRLYGFEAYQEGVNYVALNYPNTDEGKKAQEILNTAIPILAQKEFVSDDTAKNFNVIYQFNSKNQQAIDVLLEKLEAAIKDVDYFDLSSSVDVYDENTTFVVVHGLKSIDGAKGFAEILKEKDHTIEKEYFAISSPNYTIIQRHKNLDEYLQSQ